MNTTTSQAKVLAKQIGREIRSTGSYLTADKATSHAAFPIVSDTLGFKRALAVATAGWQDRDREIKLEREAANT